MPVTAAGLDVEVEMYLLLIIYARNIVAMMTFGHCSSAQDTSILSLRKCQANGNEGERNGVDKGAIVGSVAVTRISQRCWKLALSSPSISNFS